MQFLRMLLSFHHLENLRNYVNLSPYMKEGEINGITYKMGFGSGYVGIPVMELPPSRFVRIALLREFSNPVETEEEGVMLALHLLNTGHSFRVFKERRWTCIFREHSVELP